LGLDGKGVALGAKGLVLLPSIDRLVAWLAVYTRERSLEDLLSSLELHLVRSKLGTREITFEFAAESSDRMDRIAETGRLVGGFTFTGTSRHFVQYRDASAPFGYDAGQLLTTEAPLALYHDKFTQVYEVEKSIEIRALLLRLMPHVDPSTLDEGGVRFVVAEQGLGPALIHYLVRSRVDAEVGLAEWPPESAFDDGPKRRYVFRIPELPARMRPLIQTTPGLTTFLPAGPGVGVEVGYRHPVALRACPIFDAAGMVFLRGRGDDPWTIEKLPQLGDVRAFARVEVKDLDRPEAVATATASPPAVRVPLRMVPSTSAWKNVTASWIPPNEVPLLRKISYALPPSTIAGARVAVTQHGAFLRCPRGVEAIPLGVFFVEFHPQLFIPAGHEVIPSVAPEVLARAIGAPSSLAIFLTREGRALGVEEGAFAPLETMMLEAKPWEPIMAESIERALGDVEIDLKVEPLGLFPLRGTLAPDESPDTLRQPGRPELPGEPR
jgi:hypothetical protein